MKFLTFTLELYLVVHILQNLMKFRKSHLKEFARLNLNFFFFLQHPKILSKL